MKDKPGARQSRSRWRTLLPVVAVLAVFAASAYTSYAAYGIVREAVARAVNLPSFETLRQEAGLPSLQPAARSTPRAEARLTQPEAGQPATETEPQEIETPQERINILLLGIDQRPSEQGPFRTDTMIMLSIDPQSGTAGMFSMPRDLWVPIPGYGENRINTAHFLGDLKKYPGGGSALAKKTVSYNFGFPVHYYVRLNFEGFHQIVDMIGGIDIEVPYEIIDDRYPDENYGYEPIHIPAGNIHMDGDLALKYARTRKADSDFHRARRQQQVIIAVKDKILQFNLLPTLLPKLPELTRTLSDSVKTDIPMDQILQLARLASSLDMNNVKTVVIDESMTVSQKAPNGADILLPIRDQIRPLVDDLFWSPLPTIPPTNAE